MRGDAYLVPGNGRPPVMSPDRVAGRGNPGYYAANELNRQRFLVGIERDGCNIIIEITTALRCGAVGESEHSVVVDVKVEPHRTAIDEHFADD